MNEPRDAKPTETENRDSAPLESEPTTEMVAPVQEKSSQKKLLVTVASIIIALIVIGVATVLILQSFIFNQKDKDATGYESATRFSSASSLVDAAKSSLRGSVLDITSFDGLGGKTATGYGAYGVPPHRSGDHKYKNMPTTSMGASYKGDSVIAAENYSKLDEFFKKNKFKEVSSGKDASGPIAWTVDDVKYVSYATYESADSVCLIWHADASGTPIGAHVTSIGCGEKTSYETAAKALEPFYAAYTKNEASPSDQIVLGNPKQAASNTKGYDVAVVYQEDTKELDTQFEGLYYKESGKTDWTYFLGSYGWLDCTEFNTDVLKKAFDGFNCHDPASDKIVNVGTGTSAPTLK